MDDILTSCDGRLLWRCLDGKPVSAPGRSPFLCPKCGPPGSRLGCARSAGCPWRRTAATGRGWVDGGGDGR